MNKKNILKGRLGKFPPKLIFLFIALALSISLLGYYFFKIQEQNITANQEKDIEEISALSAKQIDSWLQERINHSISILNNSHRIHELMNFLDNRKSPEEKEMIEDWFKSLADLYKYNNILLYDKDLNPALSLFPKEKGKRREEIEYISKLGPVKELEAGKLHQIYTDTSITLSIFVPVNYTSKFSGRETALIVFEFSPLEFFHSALKYNTKRYETMESLLAQRENDHILFLSNLKFREQSALNFKIPLTEKQLITVQAAGGKEGITYGKDYRGHEVIASITKVKNTKWFLITKVDRDEIVRPILRRTLVIFLNVIFGIILAGIVIVLVWRNQRVKYYRSLYENEARSKALTEHYAYLSKYANDIIFLEDSNFNVIEVNDKALECYGYSKDEFLKLNVKDILVSELSHKIKSVEKQLRNTSGLIFEAVHRRKDGSTFPAEVSIRSINIEGKLYYQSIIRDISERKKHEEIIRKNEILTNAVIENSPVGITIRDINGKLITYNNTWMKIWGINEEKVKELEELSRNLTFDQRYSYFGESLEKVKIAFEKGLHQFIPEVKILNPYTGKEIWLSLYLYALKSNGTVERIVSLTQEITEKKLSEEKLKESEEKHRSIIENSTILFYSHTADHKITYISPQCRQFFDCEPEAALIKWTEFATDNPVNELGLFMTQKAIETGKPQPPYELELKGMKGRIIWVVVHESPVVVNGKTVAMVGSLTDITLRKQAEEKLLKLNRIYHVLSEINQVIVRTKDEKELLQESCRILVELGGLKMVWVAEFNREAMSVSPAAVFGFDKGYVNILISNSKEILDPNKQIFKQLSETQILIYNNLENREGEPWSKETIKRGYKSFCAINLYRTPKRSVILSLYSDEKNFFKEKEVELLSGLSADIAFAIKNLEQEHLKLAAETELRKSKEQLETLYETIEKLNRSLNLDDTYKAIYEFVSKFMDCEGLILSEYDEKEKKIHYTGAWIQGYPSDISSVPPVDLAPEGKGILSRAIRTGRSFIINDYETELEKAKTKFRVDEKGVSYDFNSERKDDTRSAIMVPLKIEGKVKGVIHITSYRKNAYTEEHLKLLESISVHISFAINNANLYRLAQEEIKERIKTEEELIKSEEQLKKLSTAVEQSPVSIIITDVDGNIEYVNPKFTEVSGYSQNEVLGENPRILKSGKNPEKLYKDLWLTITSGEEWHGELHNKKKNGELHWEWVSISPILDSKGKIINYLAVKEDITKQKVLLEQIQFQAILMENIRDAIIYADNNHVIKSWNASAEELYRWKASEVIGKRGPDFLLSRFVDTDTEAVLNSMDKTGKWTGEVIERRKDGKWVNILASYSFVKDGKGNNIGYLSVNRDITNIKEAEERIKTSLKDKEILLKEIHHRVKNNLQVISSLLKMQSTYINDAKALDYFKESAHRVKSMSLIHEQLYRSTDLSKIDFENYIKKLTTHLFQTYGVNPDKIGISIKVKKIMLGIDTAIPCGLLVNELVSNSIKHAFPEGRQGKISVVMQSIDNKFTLKISDNGTGIPDNLDFRDTETLGMQLINTLTEQLEGEIELNKEHGTEFIISFTALEYKQRI